MSHDKEDSVVEGSNDEKDVATQSRPDAGVVDVIFHADDVSRLCLHFNPSQCAVTMYFTEPRMKTFDQNP